MWPHVTFVAVFGALAGSLFVLLTHARRSRDYV
jgi:hypothetical protein